PEVLHALCLVLERDDVMPPARLLEECELVFHFVEAVSWRDHEFGGSAEVLSRLAFLCWLNARRSGNPSAECHWAAIHRDRLGSSVFESLWEALTSAEPSPDLFLHDSEAVFLMCELLSSRAETAPALVRDLAEAIFRRLSRAAGI